MSRGVHRVTADSLAGRRMTQAKGAQIAVSPLSDHNRAIEEKRRAELAARKARREKR